MSRDLLTAAALAASALTFAAVASPADAQSRRTPQGSYTQSCTQISHDSGRLTAQCQDTRGGTRRSTLESARCGRNDIANDDGILICGADRGVEDRGRPGRPGPGWNGPDRDGPGQWGQRMSITVYRDSNYRGQQQAFSGEVANLRNVGMNDAISSLRMGRGDRWEVCEDANFRGRCEVISGDERDLQSRRLNDRISSLRPVVGRR